MGISPTFVETLEPDMLEHLFNRFYIAQVVRMVEDLEAVL
jgi:hypothetical protein